MMYTGKQNQQLAFYG